MTEPLPPDLPALVPVGRLHRSGRLALVAGSFHLVWTAAAVVTVATIVAGGAVDRFILTAAVIGTFAFTWPTLVVLRAVWFDFDGRYLRIRNGLRPRRVAIDDIVGFEWPRRVDDWGTPVVRRREAEPLPVKALMRFEVLGITNEVEVERHLAALESELVEFRRRRDEREEATPSPSDRPDGT